MDKSNNKKMMVNLDDIPKLNNRQEMFAKLVAAGESVKQAYAKAGYSIKTVGGPYKLLQNPDVQKVVKLEQQKRAEELDFITKEWIMDRMRALENEDLTPNTRIKLLEAIAKLLGMYEDRVHVTTDQPLFVIRQEDLKSE